MSWETRLFTNISYNRKTYNSIYEVDADIEACDRMIKYCKDQLLTLAVCTEPKKMIDSDTDVLTWISTTVNNILEDLEEEYVTKFKLEILKSSWNECHNVDGLAISPPDNIHWNTSFLDGDFVKTDKPTDEDGC